MNYFKDGDKVYIPTLSTKVLVLAVNDSWRESTYPIKIFSTTFTIDGKLREKDKLPMIFPATEENRALLEKLYGVEFEKPPTPPSSREIIRAMLERGDKNVLCWVGNTRKEVESGYLWKFITEYNENSDRPYISEGRDSVRSWAFAIPIDHRTEQPITELPERKLNLMTWDSYLETLDIL